MGAPIILQDPSGLAQGIAGAGSALGQALQVHTQRKREQQGLSQFQQDIQAAQGDPTLVAKALARGFGSGAKPELIAETNRQYQAARKQNAFSTAYNDSMGAGGIQTEKGMQAFLSSYSKEGGDVFQAINFFKAGTQNQKTETTKILEKNMGNAITQHMEGGGQGSILKNQLDFLEENVGNVGRHKAIFGGRAGFLGGGEYGLKTGMFAEYENRGRLVLDGVIKIYNKAGALPQQKLKWIADNFSISPFATQDVIRGKIRALRSIQKDATDYENRMDALIEEYGVNIPLSKFNAVQKKLVPAMDKFEKQMLSGKFGEEEGKQRDVNKLPARAKKGTTAIHNKSGRRLIYSGTRWIEQG